MRANGKTKPAGLSHKAGKMSLRAAVQHQQRGELADAERIYHHLLGLNPLDAEANYKLGIVLAQQGRTADAIPRLSLALKTDPSQPHYWLSLVTSLLADRRLASARAVLDRFMERGFDDPATARTTRGLIERLFDEARADHRDGRLDEARLLYDTILLLDDRHVGTIHMAGVLAYQGKRLDEAASLLALAITYDNDQAEYHADFAKVLYAQGRRSEALAHFERATSLDGKDAQSFNNVAVIRREGGDLNGALAACKESLRLDSGYVSAREHLSRILTEGGHLDEALAYYRETIALYPDHAGAHGNYGNLLKDVGLTAEALAAYDRALELGPTASGPFSNRLFVSLYAADIPPLSLTADAAEFGRRFADPLLRTRPFTNAATTERRLRIGFISGDLQAHPVSMFLEPTLAHLDRGQFDLVAYSNSTREDDTRVRLKTLFSEWQDITSLDDEATADLIEADAIDILVDLSGHTGRSRMLVLARKPAPIQVTWIGYPATTGIKAVDYQFAGLTVPEHAEHLSIERVWRLPHMAMTWIPFLNSPPAIERGPCEDNGYLTFGYFNNYAKVTDPALRLWCRLLTTITDARFLLFADIEDNPLFERDIETRLRDLGFPMDRVILKTRAKQNHYNLYYQADVALDPFPFNGWTSSLDTMWMGVPMIALRGNHQPSRVGEAMMECVGLPELVAADQDEYVAIAARLAADRDWLRALRTDLRGRLERSPIMDHAGMAAEVGSAFRAMWRIWVDGQARGNGDVSQAPHPDMRIA